MSFVLPQPPKSLQAKNKEIYDWMQDVKSKLEKSHILADGIPLSQPKTGDMAYKAPLAWARLSAGNTGQIMTQTGTGTTAAPAWAGISSLLAAGAGITIGTTGTATIAATGTPSGTAGGYLSGTYPNPNVVKVVGRSNGSNATAGDVGEYISSVVVSGSSVAITSGTAATVTSIVLTPGDWDIEGNAAFVANAATTASAFACGINTSAATLPGSPGFGAFAQIGVSVSAGGVEPCLPTGQLRLNIAGTGTAFLVAQASFAVSTMGAYGFIAARRR